MQYAIIEEREDWIEATFPEVLNLEVLIDGLQRMNEIEHRAERVKNRLAILATCKQMDIDFEGLMQGKMFREAHDLREPSKTAVLINSDEQFGMVRMWQNLGPHQNITVEVFRERAEAERWLLA